MLLWVWDRGCVVEHGRTFKGGCLSNESVFVEVKQSRVEKSGASEIGFAQLP